jgi:hypothetical protein
MSPKQQAEAIEVEIMKTLGFQMDNYRFKQIANYTIDKIISEYKDMDNYVRAENVSMHNAILFWKEVKQHINERSM